MNSRSKTNEDALANNKLHGFSNMYHRENLSTGSTLKIHFFIKLCLSNQKIDVNINVKYEILLFEHIPSPRCC